MDSYHMAWNGMCTQLRKRPCFPNSVVHSAQLWFHFSGLIFKYIDEYDELNSRSAPSMRHINMAKFSHKIADINRATNQTWLLSRWILRLRRPCVKRWRVVAAHSRGTGGFRGCSLANPSYSATYHWQKVHKMSSCYTSLRRRKASRVCEVSWNSKGCSHKTGDAMRGANLASIWKLHHLWPLQLD